jgi:GNAT superfamily N-acetyltransferase
MLKAVGLAALSIAGLLLLDHHGLKQRRAIPNRHNPSRKRKSELRVAVRYPDVIPDSLLLMAESDSSTNEYGMYPKYSTARAGIYYNNYLVGFMIPSLDSPENQAWRYGPIYIMPEHRGKGIAAKAINQFLRSRKAAPIPIAVSNHEAQGLLKEAGFTAVRPAEKRADGSKFQWWVRK